MNEPIVAIVGRPNVGKSTLFNRIIRRREAIVDGTPGITRDRKSAETEWEDFQFTLVDTGGYIPKTRDVIESGVTHQVRLAIEEADLIIFLVDCTTGITDVDGEVAKLLRKSNKSYLLVVNKVDQKNRELDAAEFVRLGLGEPISVSSTMGRGIGDLLSLIVEKLGQAEKKEPLTDKNVVKLAVVGKPNVGKSTFINVILGEERLLVTEIPGTTRDTVDVRIRFREHEFLLIDTAGIRRKNKVKENIEYYSSLRTHRVIERCEVAIVFLDAEQGITQQDLRIIREVIDNKKGLLVVVNKWDLIENNQEEIKKWEDALDSRLRGMSYIPILFVSCKTKLRVKKVLELAWKISQERKKRIASPVLNRLIDKLNRKYQPPAVRGKCVRILYGTQSGINPPRFVFFSNYPYLIKESYKKFLENHIRENFGFEGVPLSLTFKRK